MRLGWLLFTTICLTSAGRSLEAALNDPAATNIVDAAAIAAVVADPISVGLALCADETNRYRGSIGLAPLARSAALEQFAMRAAAHDGAAHAPHAHFAATNGAGVAAAETEVLWWQGFTLPAVIKRGLSVMWEVGPGGEHYDIMAGPFTEIGCGISINNGEITVTQDFR